MREYERQTLNPFDVRKVKSLGYRAVDAREKAVIEVLSSGALKGSIEDVSEPQPLTVHKFINKHRVLMHTWAFAVSPVRADAEWSTLLDYHEKVVLQSYEVKDKNP